MRSWDQSSVAINKKFFSTSKCLCYTDWAFNSVSLLISLQLKAKTQLAKHRPRKQEQTVNLGVTDLFNKRIVTKTVDQLKGDAKTIKGNCKHA